MLPVGSTVILDVTAPHTGLESEKAFSTRLSFINAAELRTCFNRHVFMVILHIQGPRALIFSEGAHRACRLPWVLVQTLAFSLKHPLLP